MIPQLKLWDEDSTGVDIILNHRAGGRYRNIGSAPDSISFLLARRAPPVPTWFIEGVLNFYQTQQLERIAAADPTRVTERVSTVFGTFEGEVMAPPANTMESVPPLPPLVWISPTISALLRAHPEFLSLMPLQELLGDARPRPVTNGRSGHGFPGWDLESSRREAVSRPGSPTRGTARWARRRSRRTTSALDPPGLIPRRRTSPGARFGP